MRWPDFSHYGNLKLVVATLPNGHRKLVMVGGDRYQVLMQNLGFVKHGNFWMRDQLRFNADDFKRAFPRMFIRSIPDDQIRFRMESKSRESIDAKVSLLTANPIGHNYLGELVQEGADGRFIHLADGTTITADASGPRFLSLSKDALGVALQRELVQCMGGAVEEIVKGRVFRGDDLNRLVEKIIGPREDVRIGDAYGALSTALLQRLRRDMAGTGDNEYRLSVKLHEGLPPLDQDAEKSITPLPLGLAVQRMLGTSSGAIAVNSVDNGAFISAHQGSVKVISNDDEQLRMLRELGLSASLAKEGDRFDLVAASLYGESLATAEKVRGMEFNRGDHIKALELLHNRRDSGRSVFVLGSDADAKQGEPGEETRKFLEILSTRYAIEKVAELDGALFGRSGFNSNRTLLVVGARRPAQAQEFNEIEVIRDYGRLWEVSEAVLVARNEAVASGTAGKVLDENSYQAPYVPVSQVSDPVLMTPRNLVAPTRKALANVEYRRGNIDQFVASALAYDASELGEYLSAEQVDAVALALDAHLRGKGFILADQTGSGKGRVLAAIARYSAMQGISTVFLTEKRDLFTDFWRDIEDTGSTSLLKPFVINEGVSINNSENERVFRGSRKEEVQEVLDYELHGKGPKPAHNLYMATYSQFNKEHSPKANWLARAAAGAFVILDESHVAAGEESATGANVRAAMRNAEGVIYSSATFAKDIVNMDLYARAFPDSVRVATLKETLKAGGEALQEVFTGMLAEDGVFIRRELDLSDVEFTTLQDVEHAERNEEFANQFAGILEVMGYMSSEVADFVSDENARIKKLLKEEDEAAAASAGPTLVGGKKVAGRPRAGRMGLYSMNWGSALYSVMRQFFVAIKADLVVDMAMRDIEQGKKPVIVVEQTMESMLRYFVDNKFEEMKDDDLALEEEQDPVALDYEDVLFNEPVTFRDVLRKMVDRLTTVRGIDADGVAVDRHIQSDSLTRAREAIDMMIDMFPDLPVSPIDVVRDRLAMAGYSCGELSGRSIGISEVTVDGVQRWKITRPNTMSRAQAIHGFNNGELDALVLTAAGSTGISLHSSERFLDQRQRSLIEWQIANRVDTRIQFFGRVGRKGQVCPPVIRTVTSNLPSENRLLSMQNAKLRKLSANTTSNRDNAALSTDFPDVLNIVGNEVARRYMQSNNDIPKRLGIPLDRLSLDAAQLMSDKTWYVNVLTARMGMLKVDDTRKIYDDIARDYDSYLQELDAKGQNPFKANELEIEARVVDRNLFEGVECQDYPSVFDAPVYYTVLEYEEKFVPMRAQHVRTLVNTGLNKKAEDGYNGFALTDIVPEVRALLPEALANCLSKEHETVEAALQDTKSNAVKACQERYTKLMQVLPRLEPGFGITFSYFGELVHGIITEVRPPRTDAGTYRRISMASWYDIRIAVPGQREAETFTLSQLLNDAEFRIHDAILPAEILQMFDTIVGQGQTRRKAILDGNMFSAANIAAQQKSGMPMVYTDHAGVRQRGVLLPVSVAPAKKLTNAAVRMLNAEEVITVMMDAFGGSRRSIATVYSGSGHDGDPRRDAIFSSTYRSGTMAMLVPRAKTYGEKWYKDPDLNALMIKPFSKAGSEQMAAQFMVDKIPELITLWYTRGWGDLFGKSMLRDSINQARKTMMERGQLKGLAAENLQQAA